ncbi:MAG: ABC transporter substrate-binding protein, partial [Saprospiraceae bacterium]|nr:ABC transporter substrate-binding protein [Saprospiraceae bacterium]
LRIRIEAEPDKLNPLLSRQSTSAQIEKFIFSPLQDYDPFTLQLTPVLLEAQPSVTLIDTGEYQGGVTYNMRIRDEARWDDRTAVTGYDYVFTYKIAINPYLENLAWKNLTASIADIEVDSLDPKRIRVFLDRKYMLGDEIVTGLNIFPEHIYDEAQILRKIAYAKLKTLESTDTSELHDSARAFGMHFQKVRFSRETVEGSGPYRFVQWSANQQIVLERKENWWGSNLDDLHPLLSANPARISYYMVPDEQTAVTSLKDGRLDIVADISPELFQQLRSLQSDESNVDLLTSTVLRYFYIGFNSAHPILQDRTVRRALAHLLDIKLLCSELFYGLATPIVGPINPSKPYYNQALQPIPFAPALARRLLAGSGWSDGNADGILDKEIDGKHTDLRLRIFTTRSQLSQDVAILLKNACADIGIALDIIPNEISTTFEMIRRRDYELAALSVTQSPSPYDPYASWHSDNANPTGNNHCHFISTEADSVIEELRVTLDEKARRDLYLRFQQIIYEHQPALFLVSPMTAVAYNKNLDLQTLRIRPGYYENLVAFKK